jgi:hypothetical protein
MANPTSRCSRLIWAFPATRILHKRSAPNLTARLLNLVGASRTFCAKNARACLCETALKLSIGSFDKAVHRCLQCRDNFSHIVLSSALIRSRFLAASHFDSPIKLIKNQNTSIKDADALNLKIRERMISNEPTAFSRENSMMSWEVCPVAGADTRSRRAKRR